MLISEIILEVIAEVGADSEDSALITKMLGFTKGALRRFPLFAKSRLFNLISSDTLSAGESYISTPAYFISEKQIWYVESGKRQIITKKWQEEFSELINSEATGKPEYYYISGNVIYFDKKCDTDRIIYIEHEGEVDDITAASNFFGSSDMLEILKDGIKATYYSDYTEDTAKGDKKMALFKAGLDKLTERNMIETMGGHIGD